MRFSVLRQLAVHLCTVAALVEQNFVNEELKSSVDLTAPYLRESVKVRARNIASGPVSDYALAVPASNLEHIAAIEASDSAGTRLSVSLGSQDLVDDVAYFSIEFAEPIPPKGVVSFVYALGTSNVLRPYPATGGQDDQQLFLYNGTRTVLSAYDTESQLLTLKTVTQQVRDLETGQAAKGEKSDNVGGLLQFGPFKSVKALQTKPLVLQYENPLPQLRFKNVDRKVWISHWGDAVSFDESYDLYNAGTVLSKPFSRLGYTKPKRESYSLNNAAVKQVRNILPPKSRDAYYVDLVGNVSTSRVSSNKESTILDVSPRYPVMGGWSYNYTIGWTNSLGMFVHKAGPNEYIAAIPVIFGPSDAIYDFVSTEVIFPEGAFNIKVLDHNTRFDSGIVYSYLDTKGRPTRIFTYQNLFDEHREGVLVVSYEYSTLSALRKPATYIGLLLALFGAGYIITNLDFSL